MISLLLALAVSAAPKDCGEDRACYEQLAKTCKPVKLTQHATQDNAVMTAKGVNTSTVFGKQKKACVVEYEAKLEDVQLKSADAGAGDAAKVKEQSAAHPLTHLRCELATDDVPQWEMDAATKGRSHYPSEKLKECKAPACEPAPALDVDCVFTQCLKDEWKIQCAASGKTCSAKRADKRAAGCKLSCGADAAAECHH
ncbi:MAG: hypothetical protein QM723_32015 [Myxococcaceae bacterium]